MSNIRARSPKQSHQSLVAGANAYNVGNYAEALVLSEKSVQADSANWQAHKLRGMSAAKLGDPKVAAESFKKCLTFQFDEETFLNLVECLRALGRADEAIERIQSLIKLGRASAALYFQLGLAFERNGNFTDAEPAFEKAASLSPGWVDALNNLGHVKRKSGKFAEAEALFHDALAIEPDNVSVLDNLAALYFTDLKQPLKAIDCFKRAHERVPSAKRSFNIGALLSGLGKTEEALGFYQQSIELDPSYGNAYNDLGYIYFDNGMMEDAEHFMRKAVECNPARDDFLVNLGAVLNILGRLDEAAGHLARAIELNPGNAKAHHFRAMAMVANGQHMEAIETERHALSVQPDYFDALIQLAALEGDAGYLDDALTHYADAMAIQPNDAIRVLHGTLIPVIMGTRGEIIRSRQRVERNLDEFLRDDSLSFSVTDLRYVSESGFYFAFHGMNDCTLMTKMSAVFRKGCPELNWRAPWLDEPVVPRAQLRIGFVSKFLFNHSVGTAFAPIIRALAQREDFEICVVSLGQGTGQSLDPVHLDLINAVDYYLPLPEFNLAHARDAIADMRFDVLIFPDLGMYSYGNFLAHFRMARVQGSFNGHPDASGISTMDYRFSWDEPGEIPGAENQYTEKLVRLKYGGLFFSPPQEVMVEFTRESVGLGEKRAYVIPAKLQKLHPDFDEALAGILRADPEGEVVIFRDGTYPSWSEMLQKRFEKTIPDASIRARIRFSPWLSGLMFKSMLLHADILLDPFHFGSGTTAFLANSIGVPMVTMPGELHRSRALAGFYEMFGVTDTITASVDEYVRLAVELAKQPERKKAIGAAIKQGLTTFKADADGKVVAELADALIRIAAAPLA